VFKDRQQALGKVGILFQNPDHQIIFPTVVEEICFGLTQQGQRKDTARQVAKAALEKFGQVGWAERSISTLSQGQRHLVCLISVLAMQPAVIVMDEPFTGLDRPTTRKLTQMLREMQQTVLHISHDLEALQDADRVIWIEQGKLQMDGAPNVVLPAYMASMDVVGGQDAFADITD
jgi:biotin transport system ATP-binding protein